jgi:Spy/CpxP family protein refolding chaperone
MAKQIGVILIVLSVALNVAFIGAWVAQAFPTGRDDLHAPVTDGAIWCPLHRKLGTTRQQWALIEPRLKEFKEATQELCATINEARREMIDLIAVDEPNREAILAKREQILAGQRKMQGLVIDRLLGEKEILTGEQQAELFALMRQRAGCAGQGPMKHWMQGDENGQGRP